jgi:hypothetical protein
MEWAIFSASIALVLVTIVYVAYTARMAREMQSTRLQNVRPRLGLDVDMRSGTLGELVVHNLGPGNALHLDVQIAYEPVGLTSDWRAPMLVAGDRRQFWMPALEEGGRWPSMEDVADAGIVVQLTGTLRDVYDAEHVVDEQLDLAAWWRTAVATHQRLITDPAVEAAEALSEIRHGVQRIPEAIEDLGDLGAIVARIAYPEQMPAWSFRMGGKGFFVWSSAQRKAKQSDESEGGQGDEPRS